MAGSKLCLRCGRSIDEGARNCVYCNWDQTAPFIPPVVNSGAIPVAAPIRKQRSDQPAVATRLLMIVGIIALLAAVFTVGGLVYGLGSHEKKSTSHRTPIIHNQPELSEEEARLQQQPLPQVAEAAPTLSTSASTDTGNGDPSALSASQYNSAVTQSAAPATASTYTSVDPLTLTGTPRPQIASSAPRAAAPTTSAPNSAAPPTAAPKPRPAAKSPQREAAREPQQHAASSRHTLPRPIEQPLGELADTHESGTVRLSLAITPGGRVSEIEVLKGSPGLTAQVIQAAQHWKFEPATEDGRPVAGKFLVDISFNGND